MAPLYGRLRSGRGEATRTGHDVIEAVAETWTGKVTTTLWKDGSYSVEVSEKHASSGKVVASGNVDAEL